jgi:hypothetical protein
LIAVEGVPNIPMFRKNTAAFVYELLPSSSANIDGDSNYVRVQVLTNAGALGDWGLWGHAHVNEELVTTARRDREAPGLTKQMEGENEK